MDIAAILELFFYAIVVMGKILLKVLKAIGWFIMQLQFVLLKIGVVFCVMYDVCAVASITAVVMKNKGMSNVLTKLFDRLLNGKIVKGCYHWMEKTLTMDFGSGALWIVIGVLLSFLILILVAIIGNAIIWWPFMIASIVIQILINFIPLVRFGSNQSNPIELITPVTEDLSVDDNSNKVIN